MLYETDLEHSHPDFARDTILKDEIVDGYRIVTIINHDTQEKEVWYMYLESATIVEEGIAATSTAENFASTSETIVPTDTASTTQEGALVLGTTTTVSSTTQQPVLNLLKQTWKKYYGKELALSPGLLVIEIQQQEELDRLEDIDTVPNFASDTIKRIKGVLEIPFSFK